MDDVNPEDGVLNSDDELTNATVILKCSILMWALTRLNGPDSRTAEIDETFFKQKFHAGILT